VEPPEDRPLDRHAAGASRHTAAALARRGIRLDDPPASGRFRSALAGQANAILVHRSHEVEDLGHERISDPGRERRLVQAVRVDGHVVVANLHATNDLRRPEVPRAELHRALAFAEGVACRGEPVVMAGAFNVPYPTLHGYSDGTDGMDHVLVRGAEVSLRSSGRSSGVLTMGSCSDHAPVELTLRGSKAITKNV
jgi:endonuclease/exonuclease/phosphatase family metal-dependent hydrolase